MPKGILKRLGVSHSTFINMSYRAVVEAKGIPLSLHIPNKETASVLADARKPLKRKQFTKRLKPSLTLPLLIEC